MQSCVSPIDYRGYFPHQWCRIDYRHQFLGYLPLFQAIRLFSQHLISFRQALMDLWIERIDLDGF